MKLANDMVTTVRQRVSCDRHDRRSRASDLTWANRLLLTRGYDSLSERGRVKLKTVLASNVPTHEIGAAWGVKEQLRRLLATTSVSAAQRERATFNQYVTWAALPEANRLKEDDRFVGAGHRHVHPHPSDQRQDRSSERDDQEHQTHRPRLPLTPEQQMPHHALHRHPDGGVTTRSTAGSITRKVEDPSTARTCATLTAR